MIIEKKKYEKPECLIIEFLSDDIILTSGEEWDIGGIDDIDIP